MIDDVDNRLERLNEEIERIGSSIRKYREMRKKILDNQPHSKEDSDKMDYEAGGHIRIDPFKDPMVDDLENAIKRENEKLNKKLEELDNLLKDPN